MQCCLSSAGCSGFRHPCKWMAFTQFEAIYARRAYPCFDEPSFKVPWQVTVRVPQDYTAVSSTTLTFNPGQTSKSVQVAITNDEIDEWNEPFVVNLADEAALVIAVARPVHLLAFAGELRRSSGAHLDAMKAKGLILTQGGETSTVRPRICVCRVAR